MLVTKERIREVIFFPMKLLKLLRKLQRSESISWTIPYQLTLLPKLLPEVVRKKKFGHSRLNFSRN